MRYWVGITDWDWFQFLRARQPLDEVNFWQPSAGRRPVKLERGALFLLGRSYLGRCGPVADLGRVLGAQLHRDPMHLRIGPGREG